MITINEFRDLYKDSHNLSLYKMAKRLGIKEHTFYKRARNQWLICVEDGRTYIKDPKSGEKTVHDLDVLDES